MDFWGSFCFIFRENFRVNLLFCMYLENQGSITTTKIEGLSPTCCMKKRLSSSWIVGSHFPTTRSG